MMREVATYLVLAIAERGMIKMVRSPEIVERIDNAQLRPSKSVGNMKKPWNILA